MMLLSSIIIILREVLEAVILISIFLALSFRLSIDRRWVFSALFLGILSAYVYAVNFDRIFALFEGVGQEIFNAILQIGIYLCLLLFNVLVALTAQARWRIAAMKWVMILGVGCAICREGSEIFLYMLGFMHSPELLSPVMLGGVFGAGIGVSVGVLIYYLMISLPPGVTMKIGNGVLILIAASMVSQAIRLLIQVDWLAPQYALWDTSAWVAEASVTGQLLYALIGYEATPTPIELQFYLGAIALILICVLLAKYWSFQINKRAHGLQHAMS